MKNFLSVEMGKKRDQTEPNIWNKVTKTEGDGKEFDTLPEK